MAFKQNMLRRMAAERMGQPMTQPEPDMQGAEPMEMARPLDIRGAVYGALEPLVGAEQATRLAASLNLESEPDDMDDYADPRRGNALRGLM